MDEIERVERSLQSPWADDGPVWEPHDSSFGNRMLPCPPQLPHQESKLSRRTRTGTGQPKDDMDERRRRTREELGTRTGKFLPCHYFDYIGGTSTGGSVTFYTHALLLLNSGKHSPKSYVSLGLRLSCSDEYA